MIPIMYVNPALVTMFLSMLAAFLLVGGLIWRFAGRLAVMEVTLENLGKQFDRHISDCPPSLRLRAKSGD